MKGLGLFDTPIPEYNLCIVRTADLTLNAKNTRTISETQRREVGSYRAQQLKISEGEKRQKGTKKEKDISGRRNCFSSSSNLSLSFLPFLSSLFLRRDRPSDVPPPPLLCTPVYTSFHPRVVGGGGGPPRDGMDRRSGPSSSSTSHLSPLFFLALALGGAIAPPENKDEGDSFTDSQLGMEGMRMLRPMVGLGNK